LQKKVLVIGAGFAGLSAASFMAKAGWHVTLIEKHSIPGGRARNFTAEGFTFDMGPSWYWMPDVFERYFELFNRSVSDYYSIQRLDPSYRVYWNDGSDDIPAEIGALKKLLNRFEDGAGERLDAFLKEAEFKYRIGIQKLVYKPGLSITEFMDVDMMKGIFRLDVFRSIRSHIKKYFTHPRIRQLMEFPVLFLGALPENTPALYSLMNYADIVGGTWYPKGGMFSVVDGMHRLASELGVETHFNETVTSIVIDARSIKKVVTDKSEYEADVVIGGADYHHIESDLLPKTFRSYGDSYWDSRLMAPSCIMYYLGINKKLDGIVHHSLFFDRPFDVHAKEIYETKSWPSEPLFYMSVNSVTDESVAPPGCENIVLLVPVAAGLADDDEAKRTHYFDAVIERLEKHLRTDIRNHIVYKRTFGHSDFVSEYNSFKGNAYGLANTLMQTAILKPRCKSRKISNLYYTGQLTVPGPGVPPSIISGEVVAAEILKHY
jgi:phytoene desaturase